MLPASPRPGDKEALRVGDVLRGAGGKRFRVESFERRDTGQEYCEWFVALSEWNGTEWVPHATMKEADANKI